MPLDLTSAKEFIVAYLYERGRFLSRQDLLFESQSQEPQYSRNHLKIHSSISDQAINQLVEDQILAEFASSDILEEIINTGLAEDDSFADRPYISQAERYDGSSIICFGPRLNFFVVENLASLVEFSEDNDFTSFREFCLEVAAVNDAYDPSPDVILDRQAHATELAQIEAALEEIERRLLQDNDLSPALSKQKEALVSEVRLLRGLIAEGQVRATVIVGMAKKTLGWIGKESVGAVVGGVAVSLLAKIVGLF
ncbi:MAG TPA: hypothetical protein VF759_05280 [Allosphingosinicella sp.]|jgi:hypothetical protein